MTRRTWYHEDGPDHRHREDNKIQADDIDAQNLWTRRSALALTAGFMAAGTTSAHASAFRLNPRPTADRIVISKRNRVMELINGDTILTRYRIHLGFTPIGHKTQYGDGKTPEGHYYIDRRNARSDFHLSLGISYPNTQDVARALAQGKRPGGDIFIHGGPRDPRDRRKKDWTAGCVAVSDREIEEIWSMTPTGIPVTIFG